MAYNAITNRTDAQALVPEEVSRAMLGKATEQSAVLRLFQHIPVQRNQIRFPILSALPTAYFVSGDTGLKQTTDMAWSNKYLNVEEIATIMPVPDAVLADVEVNIWDQAMPLLTEAFARVLDAAVFFGTNAPSTWPDDILTAALAANTDVAASSAAASGGIFNDVDSMHAAVEACGFGVTGWVAELPFKSRLRKGRDSTGRKLDEGRVNGSLDSLDGFPILFPMQGLFPQVDNQGGTDGTTCFGGQWSEFVVGVRQDITMKILTEGVIQDSNGTIIYNLAQQDMTAVRLVFRVGWQVSNRINNQQPTEASRYPVSALQIIHT
jgi:HK97 family phage major capsid protein